MLRRSTLIVLIVFLVLVGVVVYLHYFPAEAETLEATASGATATVQVHEQLFDFDPAAVSGLRVDAADGRSVVIEQNEAGAFVLAEPETSAEMTDAPRIFEAIGNLSLLEATFTLDPQMALDVLGLDDPGYEVTVFLEDDEQIVLLVGDQTPPKTGYYVQVEGSAPKAVGMLYIDDLIAFFDDPPVVPTPTPEPQEAE